MDGIHPHIPTTAVQWRLELHCNDLQGILFSWTSFVFLWLFPALEVAKQVLNFFRFNSFQSIVSNQFCFILFTFNIFLHHWNIWLQPNVVFTKYSCCSLNFLHFFCLTHCLAFDFWDRRTFCNSCIQDFCNAQLCRWNNTIWKPGLSSVWLYLCFLYFHSQLLTAQNGSQVRPGCVCVFVLLYLYIFTFVNVINVQLRPSREMAQIGSQV